MSEIRRATIIALGSRGDIQPMAVLAGGLHAAGVDTHVIAMSDYADLLSGTGAEFHSTKLSMSTMADTAHGWRGRLALTNTFMQVNLLNRWMDRLSDALMQVLLDTVQPGDLLLSGILTRDCAAVLGRERGCRPVTVLYSAAAPSAYADSCFNATPGCLPAPLRRAKADFGWSLTEKISTHASSALRRTLGSPAAIGTPSAANEDIVLAASPTLVPPAPDWPTAVHQTGYVFPPNQSWATPSGKPESHSWTPPSELHDILARHPRPVFVGFGSATEASLPLARRLTEAIVSAAELADLPIITPATESTPAGWISEHVLSIDAAPHDWLFPQVAGVVHHGGAGTATTALRAGVPSAAVPFVFDQAYHGRRLAALRVGPPPLPAHRITGERLAHMLTAMTQGPDSAVFAASAVAAAERVRHEDGLRSTLEFLLA